MTEDMKDEELLDFGGSECGFGSDEDPDMGDDGFELIEQMDSVQKIGATKNGLIADTSSKECVVTEQVEKEGQTDANSNLTKSVVRKAKQSKSDLEDGELLDMVLNKRQSEHGEQQQQQQQQLLKDNKRGRKRSNESMLEVSREAEGNPVDERDTNSRYDRKRRGDRERFPTERHSYISRDRKEVQTNGRTGNQDRFRASGRQNGRYGGIPNSRNNRADIHHGGHNFGGFARPDLAPGIMGPGRPLLPMMGSHIPFPPHGPGFEPSLGMISALHFQELLAQEHMLRSQQQMQLAQLGIQGPGHPRNGHAPPLPGLAGFDYLPPNVLAFDPSRGLPRSHQRPNPNGGRGISRAKLHSHRQHFDSHMGFAGGGENRGQSRRDNERLARTTGVVSELRLPARPADWRQPDRGRNLEPLKVEDNSKTTARPTTRPHHKSIREATNSTNVIRLNGHMQKSRVLTVSGLVENTPMSAVVETFEKQGKITDFKKNQAGTAFTITFSNIQEALSARRHLHRSMLGDRQITVEYATE